MKKILATITAVALGTVLMQAQGTIAIHGQFSANADIFTNTSSSGLVGGTQSGGVSGLTGTAANGFYYALFIQQDTGTLTTSTNALTGGWSQATLNGTAVDVMATNISGTAGSINAVGS